MLMPGRNYNSTEYRFGFNGQEKDDEIAGVTGANLDFGAREYDCRIGRWWAIDPLAGKYPSLSPYNFCANNPIVFKDAGGREIVDANGNRITFEKRNGKIVWSANATDEVKRVGNLHLMTLMIIRLVILMKQVIKEIEKMVFMTEQQ